MWKPENIILITITPILFIVCIIHFLFYNKNYENIGITIFILLFTMIITGVSAGINSQDKYKFDESIKKTSQYMLFFLIPEFILFAYSVNKFGNRLD